MSGPVSGVTREQALCLVSLLSWKSVNRLKLAMEIWKLVSKDMYCNGYVMVQFDAIRFLSWQGVAAASCSARGDTEGQRSGDQGALLHFAWVSIVCTHAL